MKNLLIVLTLLLATTSFATTITKNDLLGISVATLDIEGPFYVVQLIINTDGTYKYRDANMDEPMPKPGCAGTYTFDNGIFTGELDCSYIGGPKNIIQTVDFANTSKEQLNSEEGASVFISSSLMGEYEMPFKIFKRTELYFRD